MSPTTRRARAPRERLPADPAARADPARGRAARPRDARRGARRGPRAVEAVNVSTVYRTLEVLEELGLVRHAHLSDRAPTYHSVREPRALPPRLPELPAASISVDPDVLDAARRTGCDAEHGFTVDVGHLTVFGDLRQDVPE